jgi:NAD(P)-dependent dehydrogenase (short-subunit alcohol dehydrogenase family)
MSAEPVLIVTGAARGIGASCARLGAAAGYSVCVNYARSHDAAERLVAQLRDQGRRAIAVQADIADRTQAEEMFRVVDRELGTVTALVNNAGITGPLTPVEAIGEATLDDLFGVNVYSLFWCCAEAVKRMSTRHGGRGGAIVNVGSIAGRYGGMPGMVAYAASKAAVDGFTLGLAKEVGREGIRVNCIRPGTTRTDIIVPLGGDKLAAQVAAATPLGRLGDPDEIARAILWLLSDEASFVHGALHDVSGGR